MKNLIRAAVVSIGFITSAAWAGDYTVAVMKHRKCDSMGEAAMFYQDLPPNLRRIVIEDIQSDVKAKKMTQKVANDIKRVALMSYGERTKKEAYMRAWAWCMDQD